MTRIGVLASHEGTTLQCILDACTAGRIEGTVSTVISNNSTSGALRRARAAGIPAHHLSSSTHAVPELLDSAIAAVLISSQADIVFLAGYLKRLGHVTLAAFPERILNTHPALLPKFGGPGMFGDYVFKAVLAAGESESGVSVHLVDREYDTGRIIRQARLPVEPTDSVETLKARTQACERELIVDTLAAIAAGEIRLDTASYPCAAPAAASLAGRLPAQVSAIVRPSMPEHPLISKLQAQLARFHLSSNDFEEALSYLYASPAADAVVIRRALLTAAILAYARPFSQNEPGDSSGATSTVALKPRKLLSPGQLELHELLLEIRNRAIAHSESKVRPVIHVAREPPALLVGHQVFDVLTQPIDRPLFASLCEALHTECANAVSNLSAQIHELENTV